MRKNVDIKVGYGCNNDCFHCVIADKRRDLIKQGKPINRTTKEVFKLIDYAENEGADSIVLTGGEITIRKDCFEIVEYASKKNFRGINMQTNGRMFFYKEFAQRMAQYKKISFTIALHSADAKHHDRVTGAKGSFEQTLQGIKNLKEAGVGNRVGLKVVISKRNVATLPELVKIGNELRVGSINIAFPHAMGNARLNFFDCVPKYSEIAKYVDETIKVSNELNQHIDFEAIPLCYLEGNEHVASEFRLSDHTILQDMDHTDENYTKTRKYFAKKKGPQCKECKYFLICEGPWKDYVDGYGFEDLKPVKGEYISNISDLKRQIN
ncbi:MAG: radical SAM protein [Nanoarchaeota archaeon]|nr:radical SAM protein [Nanoarchaeota archaeon]